MHSELEQLLVLQDRQQKIRHIQTEIKTLPLERAHLESQLAATAAGVESLKQKGRLVEVERKKLELDVGTRTESISRLKTQQYQTRKNEEFRAIGHEIERYENEISKLEDQELELMIEVDKLKGELEAADKSARTTKDSISRQLADLETKSKALETQQTELTNEREALASKIDADVLDQFERLFNSKGDAAIVAVEHGVCTGCHMKVTTATAARVKAGREIVNCEQCGRILYLGPVAASLIGARTGRRRELVSDVESEQNHVAIAHFVLFSFQTQFACFACFRERTGCDQIVVMNGFRCDKPALKIGVNRTGGGRRFVAGVNGPCASSPFRQW